MKEESTKAEQVVRRLTLSPTPYSDDIVKSAARLRYDLGLVRYQLLAYTDRNNFCHSGLKAMIHHSEFAELAERLIEDKRSLGVIFRGQPQAQIEMRGVMKIVEKEWFDTLYIDETRKVSFLSNGGHQGSRQRFPLANLEHQPGVKTVLFDQITSRKPFPAVTYAPAETPNNTSTDDLHEEYSAEMRAATKIS